MGQRDGRLSARERGYTTAWDKARLGHLKSHPLCVMCERSGRVTPATVVDHIIPHRGDQDLFWDRTNWASLCETHHNSEKKAYENRGYLAEVDAAGVPTDPSHPFHGLSPTRFRYSIPAGTQPSAIPVTIVCGPPGSGKTTYVRELAGRADLVIDLDDCLEAVGAPRWSADPIKLRIAMRTRDRLIRSLADAASPRAWLIVVAPSAGERSEWKRALGPKATLVVMRTPKAECLKRLAAEPARAQASRRQVDAVRRWA